VIDQFDTVLESLDAPTVLFPRVNRTPNHLDSARTTLYDLPLSEPKPLAVGPPDTMRFVRKWKGRLAFEPRNLWIGVHWGHGSILGAKMRSYLLYLDIWLPIEFREVAYLTERRD
jgi:hypothetical protein